MQNRTSIAAEDRPPLPDFTPVPRKYRHDGWTPERQKAFIAVLDFGVARLKGVALQRAIDGYLVPVFVAGKLMGFRRQHNDALMMFCLRHYGQGGVGNIRDQALLGDPQMIGLAFEGRF